MKVTIEIPDQFLIDQVHSAYVDYWIDSIDWRSTLPDAVNEIHDDDPRTVKWIRCDWQNAVKLAVAKHPYILDPKNMDADTGDIWIQLAAFGKVKYA